MTGTPDALALSITALPVPESRLTIIRTVAPPVIIWSAMVWNWVLSPWAFWMSDWTPAWSKADLRYLRSAVSQRTDEALSGRMTPIFGVFAGVPPPAWLELPQAATPPKASRPVAAIRQMLLRIADPFCGGVPSRGRRGESVQEGSPAVG